MHFQQRYFEQIYKLNPNSITLFIRHLHEHFIDKDKLKMSQLSPVTILGGFSWIPTTRTALVDPPVLMFAQIRAPKPMEESCCLEKECNN